MIVYDFFSGTGSATKAFEDAGHTIVKVELDPEFEADERNIMDLTAQGLIDKYGQPNFIWASPPCQKFSVASLWKYWEKNSEGILVPKHPSVHEAINLIKHALNLILELKPTNGWLMENPRGILRKQDFIQPYRRRTVTYCQYGDNRMKPTDIFGHLPKWNARPMCNNGDTCHEASPAGTNYGGTGKLKNAKLRSMIPYELSKEILEVVTGSVKND